MTGRYLISIRGEEPVVSVVSRRAGRAVLRGTGVSLWGDQAPPGPAGPPRALVVRPSLVIFEPSMLLRGVTIALITWTSFSACAETPVARPCSNIPPGGCPLARGVSCADPSCDAVYACGANNVWELQHRCARDSGVRSDDLDPVDAGVDGREAPELDASIDAPRGAFGGDGCPSLQGPDCPLGLALTCARGCCDCEDLYVCEDGAWSLWGACGADGIKPGGGGRGSSNDRAEARP